jgi:hypothetical protein
MERQRRNILITVSIGLISDAWPIPGAVLAALVYREGIHSSSGAAYIVLSLALNFLLFAVATYAVANRLSPHAITLPLLLQEGRSKSRA